MKRTVCLTFCVLAIGDVQGLYETYRFNKVHVNSTTISLMQQFLLLNTTKVSKIACAVQCLEIMTCLSYLSDEKFRCELYSVNTENVSGFISGTIRIYQRQASCEDFGYISLQTTRKCMKFNQSKLSWLEANMTCVAIAGKLFGITTAEILEEVLNLIPPRTDIFIDGNDNEQEDNWMYFEGSPMSFLPWDSGQPNGGQEQNCLLVQSRKFHDAPCENHLASFVCERNFVILL